MKLHVQMTEADYLRFNDYHMQHGKTLGTSMMVLRLCVPLASVLALLLIANEKPGTLIVAGVLAGILSVLWVVFFRRLMKYFSRKGLKRMKKAGGRLPYHPEADYEFDEDAVTETTADSMFRLKYSDVQQVVWNGDDLYLYVNSMQALVVPGAGTEDRRTELERLLAGAVGRQS